MNPTEKYKKNDAAGRRDIIHFLIFKNLRSSKNVGFSITSLLFLSKNNNNKNDNEQQILIGRDEGQIQLYEFEQQQQTRLLKLVQRFPN